jgi:predicted NAD/FAD-dependent oxidoreductase
MIKITIIGAGISGLSAAHLLKDYADITLFEKECGVSGRMSTRCAEPYLFDHGKLFTPKYSSKKMLEVLENFSPKQTERCFAWDDKKVLQ